MAEEFESLFYGTEGGLDDVAVVLKNPHFAQDQNQIRDGEFTVNLLADVVPANPDDGETIEEKRFSIGRGWDVKDKGAKVVRSDGTHRGFQRRTKAQELLTSAIEAGGEELVRARWEQTGLTPQDAAFWDGFSFHLKNEEREFERDGETQKYSVMLATEFYGWNDDDEAEAPTTPTPKKKKAAKKKAKGAAKTKVPGVPDEITDALRELAGQYEDVVEEYDDFLEYAFEVEGVEDNEVVQDMLDDPDNPIINY